MLMMFGRAGFPAPNEPPGDELDRINNAMESAAGAARPHSRMYSRQHPAWRPVKATPFQFPQLNEDGDLPPLGN